VRRHLSRPLATLAAALLVGLAPGVGAQGMGPALPPGFYGELPDPYPKPEAPEGIQRVAIVATSNLVGETDPCG
jgi:hypothetical protein